jgi:hypothetical protein
MGPLSCRRQAKTLRLVAVTFFLLVGDVTIGGIRDNHWRSAGQFIRRSGAVRMKLDRLIDCRTIG